MRLNAALLAIRTSNPPPEPEIIFVMTTEIQEQQRPPALKEIISGDKMKKQFAAALPKHLSADRFCRVAITALSKNPKLEQCTQVSLFKCLLDLSAMGLEPDGRRAHLIPFKNECTLIVDYKGIVELVRRDESVVDVQCYTIRENDQVRVINGQIEHAYDPLNERGEVKAVYTRIDWASGHTSYGEPMTRQEADKIRQRSRSKDNGPWVTDFIEMWKKTAVHRDSKMWPLSSEIREAVERDFDQFQSIRNVTPPAKVTVNPFADQVPDEPQKQLPENAEGDDIEWEVEG